MSKKVESDNEEYIWKNLREKAYSIAKSSIKVGDRVNTGAAAISSKRFMALGVSINRDYPGLSICSESSLITNIISNGGGVIEKIIVINEKGILLEPCKRCLTILFEYSNENSEIMLDNGVSKITDLR